jgi:GAF domain-containing protein
MDDKDLRSDLEGLLSNIVPEMEAKREEAGVGPLEAAAEPVAAEPTAVEAPSLVKLEEAKREKQEGYEGRDGAVAGAPPASSLAKDVTLTEQRIRILNILLVSVTSVGAIAVGGLLVGLAQRPSRLLAYIPYFAAYAVLVSVTLVRRLNPTLRATVLVLLAYAVGIASLLRNGPLGTGGLYLLVAPLLFSILVRQRAGVVAAAVSVALYIAFVISHYLGWLQPAAMYDLKQLYFMLNLSGTFAMIVVGIMFIQWMFNYSLTNALREVEEKHTEAVRSQALLEARADELATANALLRKLTLQLQTAAEISRVATSVLDPGELMRQTVDLIRDRFGFYYVGLFLLDEAKRWAMLQAGTGEPGRQMLEAGHRLQVGGESMVGWCTANAQARIALDVGEEAVRFDNPLLPKTRSEMALPLISRGQIVGALTVQSAEVAAFSEEDIAVLQTVTDQVANALENARLFKETQRLAQRERTVSQITGKLRSALNLETILQTTVEELGQALGASEAIVRLGTETTLLSHRKEAKQGD